MGAGCVGVEGGPEKHRAQQVVAAGELGGRAGEADLAAFHEHGALRDGGGDVDRLLDDDHGGALRGELADDVDEVGDDGWGEAEGELVDDQEPGAAQHRLGDGEHLLLTARQRRCLLVGEALEVREQLEDLGAGALDVGAVAVLGPLGDAEVVGDGERTEDPAAAGDGDEAGLDASHGVEVGDVGAVEGDGAGGGLEEAADDAEHGGLAGAVGAEQRDDLAVGDREVDAEQDRHLAVGGVDVAAAQQAGVGDDLAVGRDEHDRGFLGRRVGQLVGEGGVPGDAGELEVVAVGDPAQVAVADVEDDLAEPAGHKHEQQEQAGAGGEQLGGAGEEELG